MNSYLNKLIDFEQNRMFQKKIKWNKGFSDKSCSNLHYYFNLNIFLSIYGCVLASLCHTTAFIISKAEPKFAKFIFKSHFRLCPSSCVR